MNALSVNGCFQEGVVDSRANHLILHSLVDLFASWQNDTYYIYVLAIIYLLNL